MNEVIKGFFKDFGLPNEVLQSINNQIMDSLKEDFTDEDIKSSCKNFESLAKSFQSTVDARVTSALEKRKVKKEKPETPEPTGGDGDNDDRLTKLEKLIQGVAANIDSLKNERINESLIEQATKKLKEIKMTDSEIRGVLHGREFTTAEAVEEFVNIQSEIHKETLKGRQREELGGGYNPEQSNNKPDLESFKNDVKNFFQQT